MPWKSYRVESRKDWAKDLPEDKNPSRDDLQFGALLRIADATEAMAKNWNDLVRERDHAVQSKKNAWSVVDELRRKNAALRGVITKMKKARK
jgi:hypothetical protein